MKKGLIVLLLALMAMPIMGQIEMDYSAAVHSAYLWRGYDLAVSPVVQPDFSVSHESGAWVDVWAAFGSGYSEVDFTAAYGYEVIPGLTVEPGFIYYLVDFDPDASTYEVFAAAYYEGLAVPINLFAAHDPGLKSTYYELSTGYDLAIGAYPLSLGAGAGMQVDANIKGLSHFTFNASTEIAAGPVMIAPILTLSLPMDDAVSTESVLFSGGASVYLP